MQRQLFQQRIRRQHCARKGILHRQQRIIRQALDDRLRCLREGRETGTLPIRERFLCRRTGETSARSWKRNHFDPSRHAARSFHSSIMPIAAIASTTGTARGKMHGSCRP